MKTLTENDFLTYYIFSKIRFSDIFFPRVYQCIFITIMNNRKVSKQIIKMIPNTGLRLCQHIKPPLRDIRFLMNEMLDYPAHYQTLTSGQNADADKQLI